MDWCDLCRADSGRFVKGRSCCDVRALAGMPPTQRSNALVTIQIEQGVDARAAVHRSVLEYRAIKLAKAPKEVRQRAYQSQQLETNAADAQLLKDLVMAEYTRTKAA